jgi:hypothetical protein
MVPRADQPPWRRKDASTAANSSVGRKTVFIRVVGKEEGMGTVCNPYPEKARLTLTWCAA